MPATLRDLCLASNSIYMHLKIWSTFCPWMCTCSSHWSQWQLHLYSWGQNSTLRTAHYQRDEVSSFEKSTSLETIQESTPPQKEETPPKKRKTHVLVILVVLLQERKIKRKVLCSCSSYSQSIICSAVPYIWIHTYMYAWVYFSEWERLYCRCSQSLNSGITDTNQLPQNLYAFKHHLL